jgi:hypothetical protein
MAGHHGQGRWSQTEAVIAVDSFLADGPPGGQESPPGPAGDGEPPG